MINPSNSWHHYFHAARPKAIAALFRYFNHLDAAEDAYQEACLKALKHWRENGLPRDPIAWLISVAKNAGIDQIRKYKLEQIEFLSETTLAEQEDFSQPLEEPHYRDDVLRLLFTCCHPSLALNQQLPLALSVIIGFSIPEIAAALLVSSRAIEQRITRAKRHIRQANIPYEPPSPQARQQRIEAVASTIYLMFNEGYSASCGDGAINERLCQEAIRLCRLLLHMYPSEPELMGLFALCLLQHARYQARLNEQGEWIVLEKQNRKLWNQALMREGQVMVEKALRLGQAGAYQLQAAIAAVHSLAKTPQETDWQEIERLYHVLEIINPTPVVTLNKAVAVAQTQGPQQALALIEPLAHVLTNYFYYHGTRGHFLQQLQRHQEARQAYQHALALARTPADATHIRQLLDKLSETP